MAADIANLIQLIEQKLDWGRSAGWQTEDFDNLHRLILDETGVSLSTSTLRRIWGRVAYDHLPSLTTLNTLARFAGFENWRSFLKQQQGPEPIAAGNPGPAQPQQVPHKPVLPWVKIAAAAAVLLAVVLVSIFAFKKAPRHVNAKEYVFSSKPVTRGIPNSVIFTYDASASPTDSVFIQQSWDVRRRALVDKNQHTHTAVYYEPGFYKAKLVVDTQVVKEHPLLVPSAGWLGIINQQPVPVYLKTQVFVSDSMLRLPVSAIEKNNIPLGPNPPIVKFYNVGNFDPVPLAGFSFSAAIKNEYAEGAAACQMVNIVLITDDAPIVIPLCGKGCVSELNLMCVGQMVSGKKADLSGFGVDFSSWANIACKRAADRIQFYVNEKKAYECPLPAKQVNIVGMGYFFMGTGAVKNIHLSSNNKEVLPGRHGWFTN